MKKLLLASLFITGINFAEAQNLKMPTPSPRQTITQEFGLGEIKLSYSRPSAKNREIYGGLVPYDAVWRTGANGATTIEFTEEVTIGGKKVAPGTYGLVTIPGKSEWKIIISKQTDITSPSAYKASENVAEVTAKPKAINAVETFEMGFNNITDQTIDLNINWGKVAVTLPIKSENKEKVIAQIKEVMNSSAQNKPYFQSAVYYFENNIDLNQAYEWMKKAADENKDAFWIHYNKAKLEAKMGKKAEAIASSEKSLELAKKANWQDYIRLNEDLLKTLK